MIGGFRRGGREDTKKKGGWAKSAGERGGYRSSTLGSEGTENVDASDLRKRNFEWVKKKT